MTTFIDTNLHNMLIDTNFHFTCHLFVDHEDKHEKHVSNKNCLLMCTLLRASTSNTVCYDVCSLLLRPQTRAVSLWSQVVSTTKRRSGLTRGDLGFLNLTRMTVE